MTSERRILPIVCLFLCALLSGTQSLAASDRADHIGYGFDLSGAHREVPCESCHVRGIFKGTPKECGYCHDGTGIRASSFRSLNHPLTTENCESCHFTTNWMGSEIIDHGEVIGSCSSCHNGLQASGLPMGHIQTNQECDGCHIDLNWSMVVFDHGSITSACASCHDGLQATGKHPLHISSSEACDDCHTTTAWIPAVFDHAGVTPGTCESCHDGQTATGMNNGHFMTNASCDDCHATEFWNPATFVHTSPVYPGDHSGGLLCVDCHQANSEQVTWTAPAYQPDCAGCHANDFRSGPHKKHENPDVSYTLAEISDCTGACHIYTDSSLSVIETFRPGPEHSVSRREW